MQPNLWAIVALLRALLLLSCSTKCMFVIPPKRSPASFSVLQGTYFLVADYAGLLPAGSDEGDVEVGGASSSLSLGD